MRLVAAQRETLMPKVSALAAIREFGSWRRFALTDDEWTKWGALAVLLNSTISGVAILGSGAVLYAGGINPRGTTPVELFYAILGGSVLGLLVGAIPALLVKVVVRRLTRRIGYINGQLALLYACLGVVICSPLISVFTVIVLPTVLVVTFLGWVWFRTSGGGISAPAKPDIETTAPSGSSS